MDLTPEDFTGDVDALQEFAADLDTDVRLTCTSGIATVIFTKLDRDQLVTYLRDVADKLAEKIDTNDGSDMVAAIQTEPEEEGQDSTWAAILRVVL